MFGSIVPPGKKDRRKYVMCEMCKTLYRSGERCPFYFKPCPICGHKRNGLLEEISCFGYHVRRFFRLLIHGRIDRKEEE